MTESDPKAVTDALAMGRGKTSYYHVCRTGAGVPNLQQREIIQPAVVACHIGELGCGLGRAYRNQSVSRVVVVCHRRTGVCGVQRISSSVA
jgi:hypothetical protein